MTAPPDRDELAMRARLRARIDGPPTPSHTRDGRDGTRDTTVTATAPHPRPPARQPVTGRRDTTTDGWWDGLYDDAHDDHHQTRRRPPAMPRLPDWRKGQVLDLGRHEPERPEPPVVLVKEPPTANAEPETAPDAEDEPDEPGEWDDLDSGHEPDRTGRSRPHRDAARRAQAVYLGLPRRTRVVLYTGTAAGAGYWTGMVPLMHGWIAACGHDTTPTAALILGLGIATACGILIDRRTRGWWGPLPWLCRIPLASALLAVALYAPGVS